MMTVNYAIYCDKKRATTIKIHKAECNFVKSHQANDDEWFCATTYVNARALCGHLEKAAGLASTDCKFCNPKPEQTAFPVMDEEYDEEDMKVARMAKNAAISYERYGI